MKSGQEIGLEECNANKSAWVFQFPSAALMNKLKELIS